MSEITITYEWASLIIHEDIGPDDEYQIVKAEEWVDEGKYQYCEVIFKYRDKFYSLSMSRSGSHYTDWYYDYEEQDEFTCPEVEKKEIVTVKWVVKSE